MATSQITLPLYEKLECKNTTKRRALNITVMFLLFTLLIYRFISLQNHHGIPWLLAFLCLSWFTFIWVLSIAIRWSPADYQTYPDRLHKRVLDLPSVDMFVTIADPVLEPPIITLNTVLSLLAIDYPTHKLACYVSDDGCPSSTLSSKPLSLLSFGCHLVTSIMFLLELPLDTFCSTHLLIIMKIHSNSNKNGKK
ncbi:hypothetical protein Ddye_016782 [Dipteronia dyeriana]|uniref:Uncharacterized protein n=1 Tax=Dipteronia dyeriana TaxID=168575 RepID=A0AAD9X0D5_9ROSI|nr:hypothetical protein Ddye_016782 [Dipteronia dyeriana]